MKFTPIEILTLKEATERCDACGHLELFHNTVCAFSCNIKNCKCEYGCIASGEQEKDEPLESNVTFHFSGKFKV